MTSSASWTTITVVMKCVVFLVFIKWMTRWFPNSGCRRDLANTWRFRVWQENCVQRVDIRTGHLRPHTLKFVAPMYARHAGILAAVLQRPIIKSLGMSCGPHAGIQTVVRRRRILKSVEMMFARPAAIQMALRQL